VSVADAGAIADRLTTLGLVEWAEPVGLSAADVDAILSSAHEGLVCLLGAAIESGLVEVDAASGDLVATAWAELMARAVQLDGLLLEVTAGLHAGGITNRVLKGVAVATLDEHDPSWRSYNDVDVLVPPTLLLDAVDVLASLGLSAVIPPVSRRWAGRYAKSITLIHPSGAQVDLHRMLATGPFGSRVRAECLFDQSRAFEVGETSIHALSDPHRLLHACYHAALGGVQGARHRRDLLLLTRSVSTTQVEAQFVDGWSPTVVATALRWAAGAPSALPDDWTRWLASVMADANDDELLASYEGSFRDGARAQLQAASGPMEKARFAAALVWPSRAHLAARGQSRLQHLRRLVRARRFGDRVPNNTESAP